VADWGCVMSTWCTADVIVIRTVSSYQSAATFEIVNLMLLVTS